MSGETGVIIAEKECMRSSLMIIEGVEKLLKTEFHFSCCLILCATVILEKSAISFF